MRLYARALRATRLIEDVPCRRKNLANVRVAFRLHPAECKCRLHQSLVDGGHAVISLLESVTSAPPAVRRLLFRKVSSTGVDSAS